MINERRRITDTLDVGVNYFITCVYIVYNTMDIKANTFIEQDKESFLEPREYLVSYYVLSQRQG
jgi:hypothetical protein